MYNNLTLEEFNSFIFKNKKDIINQYYDILEEEICRLKVNVANNKDWLERQPVMQEFLTQLQFTLQEKNIVFFSSLMTALSNDVIFNEESLRTQQINFELYVKGGMPALKINSKTFDNNFEKITSGGLRNVIATGLRVLALWRLTINEENQTNKGEFSHRRFLFLDEPDCWIANESMSNYAKLLYQLSHHFNLQILMVTHKPVEYFQPYATVYELTKSNGYSEINLLSSPPQKDADDKEYDVINSVRLQNLKVFKDMIFELDKHLTIIVGKSFIGKSVIMEAFNAILNNNSDDEIIRHYENKASVTLQYTTNAKKYSLLWERVKKTNVEYPQKVRYRLYDIGMKETVLLNDQFESYDVPDFAVNSLKMKKLDGVDIHLGLQDDMNFLFNPKISDQERAKILSLGKESSYIHKMMEQLKSKTREIKTSIKMEEKRYNILLENIVELIEVDRDDETYISLKNKEQKLEQFKDVLFKLDHLLTLWESFNILILSGINNIKFTQFQLFNLNDLDLLITKIEYLINYCSVKIPDFNNNDYQIYTLSKVDELLKKQHLQYYLDVVKLLDNVSKINLDKYIPYNLQDLDELLKKEHLLKHKDILNFIEDNPIQYSELVLNELDGIDQVGIKIKKLKEQYNEINGQINHITEQHNDVKCRLIKLKDELGSCPLCGSNLKHEH